MNELVEIWEEKISKKLEKNYVSEEELLMKIKGIPTIWNFGLSMLWLAIRLSVNFSRSFGTDLGYISFLFLAFSELFCFISETPYPDNMEMVFIYSAFVKGDQTYFDVELEGARLYPHIKYTTISEFLETLV